MKEKKIAIIGVGHIGQALVRGLLLTKTIKGQNLILANPHLDKLQKFKKDFGVRLTTSNLEAVRFADIVIIAVKPKTVKEVVGEIRNFIQTNALIISTAACVTFALLEKYFKGVKINLVRLMPNIPVAYGQGVVGWVGHKYLTEKDEKVLKDLLSRLGIVVKCQDEEELDRIDIISGCGPGIIAYFIDNFAKAARSYGFTKTEALRMAINVFAGVLHHLRKTKIEPPDLVAAVATKGGITEEIIKSFEKNNFLQILQRSFDRGYAKIEKLTEELRKES